MYELTYNAKNLQVYKNTWINMHKL